MKELPAIGALVRLNVQAQLKLAQSPLRRGRDYSLAGEVVGHAVGSDKKVSRAIVRWRPGFEEQLSPTYLEEAK